MNIRICSLPAVHLVLHKEVWLQMPAQMEQFAHWPASPDDLQLDLCSFRHGVPALVQTGKGVHRDEPQILICTPTYCLLAVSSRDGQSYFVPWMKPLTLAEHDRLVLGALLIRSPTWRVHTQHGTVPPGGNNLAQVLAAWQAVQRQIKVDSPPAYTPNAAQESYLNTVSQLIEVTRQLVLDRAALAPAIQYRAVESAGEVRHTARDVYTFLLVPGAPRPRERDFLRVRGERELRGRVMSVEGERLTIRFEEAIDHARLPAQGALERSESDRPFLMQQAAVEALRAGESKNPHLLSVLVDGAYQEYHPAAMEPSTRLNDEQKLAFRRALTVPDLLLVLGPPGTGKTKTIAEIVGQIGRGRRRVLVTAKTHKAVDNVLERLPSDLMVVRVGHEDVVSANTRHLLLESQAQALQQRLLQRTEARAQQLAWLAGGSNELEVQIGRLATLGAALEMAQTRRQAAERQIESTAGQIKALYGRPVDRQLAALRRGLAGLARLDADLRRQIARQARAAARGGTTIAGRLWAWWSGRLARRLGSQQAERRQAQADYDAAARAYRQACRARRLAYRAPEYRRLLYEARDAAEAYESTAAQAAELARRLDQIAGGLEMARPLLEPAGPAVYKRYAARLRQALPVLQRRHALLTEWRTELGSRSEQLNQVLIRFSDVVGATCIGIATAADVQSLDFDTVIADEAGQIGLPDLLVPLVRAQRALLVGDHHQLPPFVENEVQSWLRTVRPEALPDLAWVDEETTEAEAITRLMTQSAFEWLFPAAHPDHLVRFRDQHRMPQAVADLASALFYDNLLVTAKESKKDGAPHHDPLFARPLAFVDTSGLPLKSRCESAPSQNQADPEGWNMSGFQNDLEAELIADLAAVYDCGGYNWVVIVPYRAQARLIRRKLHPLLADASGLDLEERVATVDSFQGGECDRVIYGFTRSNGEGRIGFLRELRRLNVAMTRSLVQLVLVGDMATLTHAQDQPFRELALALEHHVRRRGELVAYHDCRARLERKGQAAR